MRVEIGIVNNIEEVEKYEDMGIEISENLDWVEGILTMHSLKKMQFAFLQNDIITIHLLFDKVIYIRYTPEIWEKIHSLNKF